MKIVIEVLVVTSVLGICWAKNKCSGDIRNFTHTQHCPACLPPDDRMFLLFSMSLISKLNNKDFSEHLGQPSV